MDAAPIDVIEASYRLDCTNQEWLEGVAAAIRPLIDGGLGMMAYSFDPAVPVASWFANRVTFDIPDEKREFAEEMLKANAQMSAQFHALPEPLDASAVAAFRRTGLGEFRDFPQFVDVYRRLGVADYTAFRTIEPNGRSIMCIAGQSVAERSFNQRTRRLWARVAAHVAAGRRLRAAIATRADTTVDAVFTPSGRLEHAEGNEKSRDIRETLRDAVLRQERARGRARRDDPAVATEAWTALVGGRWSLVDQFERGGRRYIVARRNEHAVTDPRALTSRERVIAHLAALGKPNKLMAYELGLGESTVGTHLAAVMRKLGVASRVDLIRILRRLPHES